jgi:hypothetical protein
MKIYFTDQSEKFPQHLAHFIQQPVMYYNKAKLTEKTTIVLIDTSKELGDLDKDFFFNYKIFPPRIMTYLTQWNFESRQMTVGDTIVQQAFIPPFPQCSQKIIFGVRINRIINDSARIGFSYETLAGHVEKGMATFTLEKTGEKKIIFKVQTYSTPGNFLTQLAGPIFSVPYQAFCTRQALLHVKQQIEKL